MLWTLVLVLLVLWAVGLLLCLVVAFGIANRLSPIIIAIAAAVMGWVISETNALRTRVAMWPTFRKYIDWKRVTEDLSGHT